MEMASSQMSKWIKVTRDTMLKHLDLFRDRGDIVRSKEVDDVVAYYVDDGRTQDEEWIAKEVNGEYYISVGTIEK